MLNQNNQIRNEILENSQIIINGVRYNISYHKNLRCLKLTPYSVFDISRKKAWHNLHTMQSLSQEQGFLTGSSSKKIYINANALLAIMNNQQNQSVEIVQHSITDEIVPAYNVDEFEVIPRKTKDILSTELLSEMVEKEPPLGFKQDQRCYFVDEVNDIDDLKNKVAIFRDPSEKPNNSIVGTFGVLKDALSNDCTITKIKPAVKISLASKSHKPIKNRNKHNIRFSIPPDSVEDDPHIINSILTALHIGHDTILGLEVGMYVCILFPLVREFRRTLKEGNEQIHELHHISREMSELHSMMKDLKLDDGEEKIKEKIKSCGNLCKTFFEENPNQFPQAINQLERYTQELKDSKHRLEFELVITAFEGFAGSSLCSTAVANAGKYAAKLSGEHVNHALSMAITDAVVACQIMLGAVFGIKSATKVHDAYKNHKKANQYNKNEKDIPDNLRSFHKKYYEKHRNYDALEAFGNSLRSGAQFTLAASGLTSLPVLLIPGIFFAVSGSLTTSIAQHQKNKKLSFDKDIVSAESILEKKYQADMLGKLTEYADAVKEAKRADTNNFNENNRIRNIIAQNIKDKLSPEKASQFTPAINLIIDMLESSLLQDQHNYKKMISHICNYIGDTGLSTALQESLNSCTKEFIENYHRSLTRLNASVMNNKSVDTATKNIHESINKRNNDMSILAEKQAIQLITMQLIKRMAIKNSVPEQTSRYVKNLPFLRSIMQDGASTPNYKLNNNEKAFDQAWGDLKQHYGRNGHQSVLLELMNKEANKKLFEKLCKPVQNSTKDKTQTAVAWYNTTKSIDNVINSSTPQNEPYQMEDFFTQIEDEIKSCNQEHTVYDKGTLIKALTDNPNLRQNAIKAISNQIDNDKIPKDIKDKVLRVIGTVEVRYSTHHVPHVHNKDIHKLDIAELINNANQIVSDDMMLEILKNTFKSIARSKYFQASLSIESPNKYDDHSETVRF